MAVNVKGTVVTPKAPVSVSGQNLGAVNKPAAGASAIGTPVRTGTAAPTPSYSYSPNMNQGAANQIVYLKQLYDQAAAAGKPKSSLNSIASKAQDQYGQLDPTTATALKGMNAQQAAAWYQGYKDQNKQPVVNNNPAVTGTTAQPTAQPVDPWADIMNNPMMQEMMGRLNGYDQQMAAYAQQQQEQQAYMQQMQAQNYQNLIGQYQTAQENDLSALDRQFEQSKSELSDSSFQDYLRAQQQMANRGLAGSGLANDQDTRLLMSNNKNLNNLQNSVLNQKAGIKQQYNGQIQGLQQQLAAINFPSVAGGSLTSRDTGTASAGRMAAPDDTSLNMMFNIMKEMNPYAMATVKDQMDFARMSQKDQMDFMKDMMPYQQATVKDQMQYQVDMYKQQFDYNKLGSEEKRFYDKLDVDSKMKIAELAQQYDLKMTDLMGYDKNGNATFAASKFVKEYDLDKWYKEQSISQGWSNIDIKKYVAENNAAQGWEKVRVAQQNADTRIAELNVKAQEITDKNARNAFKDQLGEVNNLMKQSYKEMNDSLAVLNKLDPKKDKERYDAAFERWQKASRQYEVAYSSVDALAQIGIGNGTDNVNKAVTESQKQLAEAMGTDTSGLLNKFNGGGGSNSGNSLGSLSRKYESGGDPGRIARNAGDIGGASYGTYQLTTSSGSAKAFVQSLKNTAPDAYKKLVAHPVGSKAFDAAWKQVAATNKNFGDLQHSYAKSIYYDNAAKSILKNTGLDVNKRSKAVQDAIWSTAVQHGSGGVQKVVKGAGITPAMSDTEILKRIYAERGANNGMKYFKSSSASIRQGVVNRFKNELQDALKMV
jgi:hypothetical protein